MAVALLAPAATRAEDQPKHELSVMGAGGVSTLRYNLTAGDNPLRPGFQFGLGYNYFITPRLDVGTGVEMGFYYNRVTLDEGTSFSSKISILGYKDTYHMDYMARATGYVEKQRTVMVNIPISIRYNMPLTGRTALFLSAGYKLGLPVSTSFRTTTDFVQTSMLEQIDGGYRYEFVEDLEEEQANFGIGHKDGWKNKGDYRLGMSHSLTGEAGLRFALKGTKRLYAGAFIDYGMNCIRSEGKSNATIVNPSYSLLIGSAFNRGGSSVLEIPGAASHVRTLAFGLKLRLAFSPRCAKPVPAVIPCAPAPKPEPAPAPAPAPKPAPVVMTPAPTAPAQTLTAAERQLIASRITYGDVNNTSLSENSREILDMVATLMQDKPWLNLIVEGHTCDLGSDAVNERLGMQRAQAAADYLASKGVDSSRVSVLSKSSREPLVPNTSEDNRRINRRAELKPIQ